MDNIIKNRIIKFALRNVSINKSSHVKTVARLLVGGMKCRGIKCPRSGLANLFQIACQYFKFEKQKHSRVPCILFFLLHLLLLTIRTYFQVFGDLHSSKINVTSAVVYAM